MAPIGEKNPNGRCVPKKEGQKRLNAKYVHGVTKINRSQACPIPTGVDGQEPELEPSLSRGQKKCRSCYKKTQPCKCGTELYETDVDVIWTRSSAYQRLPLPVVRRLEDIAIAEAKCLGMSCVIIRKEQHNTYTQRDETGRKTGLHPRSDWHITVYFGDTRDKLLLQGHCYLFMNSKQKPQCKLREGNRTILEPHELLERLTLKEAAPAVYWGMNGSAGWVMT